MVAKTGEIIEEALGHDGVVKGVPGGDASNELW